MKLLTRLALLGAVTISQCAWADVGPLYVSYPGYCNVKQIYMNVYGDIYGAEVGCTTLVGLPLIGTITSNGYVSISNASANNGLACTEIYSPNGTLQGGCSDGFGVQYADRSNYTVRSPNSNNLPQYIYSTEMPDLEKIKNLPQRP